MQPAVWPVFAAALASYGLGALPFSLWVARLKGVDIQRVGSRNPGATNVARSLGLKWGSLALALDLGKGVLATGVVTWIDPPLAMWGVNAPLALGAFAVAGHNWSVFLRFHGGKGVATSLGVLLVVSWPAAVLTAGVWALLVALTRKVSVGSVVALMVSPVLVWMATGHAAYTAVFVALGVLGLVRHRQNIARVIQGKEHGVSGRRNGSP